MMPGDEVGILCPLSGTPWDCTAAGLPLPEVA